MARHYPLIADPRPRRAARRPRALQHALDTYASEINKVASVWLAFERRGPRLPAARPIEPRRRHPDASAALGAPVLRRVPGPRRAAGRGGRARSAHAWPRARHASPTWPGRAFTRWPRSRTAGGSRARSSSTSSAERAWIFWRRVLHTAHPAHAADGVPAAPGQAGARDVRPDGRRDVGRRRPDEHAPRRRAAMAPRGSRPWLRGAEAWGAAAVKRGARRDGCGIKSGNASPIRTIRSATVKGFCSSMRAEVELVGAGGVLVHVARHEQDAHVRRPLAHQPRHLEAVLARQHHVAEHQVDRGGTRSTSSASSPEPTASTSRSAIGQQPSPAGSRTWFVVFDGGTTGGT